MVMETDEPVTDNESDDLPEEAEPSSSSKKPPKRGIIYLSTIPPFMNVSKIREIFGEYGTVGRVYLQLREIDPKKEKGRKKRSAEKKFTEGWVEFEKKSIAKRVVELLNSKQVSSRKKSKHYDCIWNLKYLSGFKWTHLHERLAYEKAARRQKLKMEISLAKQKANYFSSNLGGKNNNKKQTDADEAPKKTKSKSKDIAESSENREDFLKLLF